MAITREKKEAVVAKVADLLSQSRLTVTAHYSGLSVADMQALRREAKQNKVAVTIAKNRLVKLALERAQLPLAEPSLITGQLLLAIGTDDVAPAQTAATFAKTHPELQIVGGFTHDGTVLSAEQVSALAALPSQDVLRAQVVGTLAAPLSGLLNVFSGNIRGLVNVLNARAEVLK